MIVFALMSPLICCQLRHAMRRATLSPLLRHAIFRHATICAAANMPDDAEVFYATRGAITLPIYAARI